MPPFFIVSKIDDAGTDAEHWVVAAPIKFASIEDAIAWRNLYQTDGIVVEVPLSRLHDFRS